MAPRLACTFCLVADNDLSRTKALAFTQVCLNLGCSKEAFGTRRTDLGVDPLAPNQHWFSKPG